MPTTLENRSAQVSLAPTPIGTALSWYALRTKSRHEKMVRDRLSGIGVEPFLPLTHEIRQWSDRRNLTQVPLFAGYCFARLMRTDHRTVLQLPGVACIVGAITPEPISDSEIESLRILCSTRQPVEPIHEPCEGSFVQIASGPLCGVRGQVIHRTGARYLVLRVNLIHQAAAVRINSEEVILLG